MAADQQAAAQAASSPKKTAVIVVHGMGEPRPMETLWGVVDALWSDNPAIQPRHEIYSKPDSINGSFELHRVTTSNAELEGGRAKRVDFFEFYWAHLMTGNTVKSVTSWLGGLLFRNPATVPRQLLAPWLLGLTAFVVVGASVILASLPKALQTLPAPFRLPAETYTVAGIVAFLFGIGATRWLAPVAGDAARYLSATPDNIAARQKIREAGVDLLQKLHASQRYDRIIVLGHSLGSVIAYDVLSLAWGRIEAQALSAVHVAKSPVMKALAALELAAGDLRHAPAGNHAAAQAAYRAAQRTYQAELAAAAPTIWLVSDFVSVGSPLSKAHVLLAATPEALERKKALREAASCPPWLEADDAGKRRYRFSYPLARAARIPHFAAVFAPVVWTNIYFPSVAIVFGDLISGPVAPRLGRGIRDVALKIGAPVFRHLDYWKDPKHSPPHPWIVALRRAVNLQLTPED